MKTQISKQHANAIAVQQQSSVQQRARCSFNWLKLFLFATVVFAMALPSMAATCNPISCTDAVGRIYVSPTTDWPGSKPEIYVTIANPSLMGNVGCTRVSGVYFTLLPSHPGYDQAFSLLVEAKNTGKPVLIRLKTPSTNCEISYVVAEY